VISLQRKAATAALALCLGGLAACSTVGSAVGRLNPFGGGDDGPEAQAAEGRRISVVAFDQTVTAAEALAGVDFALPEAQPLADWPLPGGTAEQSVEHIQAAPNFEIAWRKSIGRGADRRHHVTAPPVAAGGRVFTMDGEAGVTASDAASGDQVWRVNLQPSEGRDREAFGGGLAYADGTLFVTSGFRFVAALDAATGAVRWTTPVDAPIHSAPNVAGGRVFVVSTDNELNAFDAATGAPIWTYQALAESARILAASSPAVSGDTVIAPFASGELVALLAANGNDLWTDVLSRASRTSALSEIRDIAGRPVIYRGDVFAASHSGVFSATDLRTGSRRWSLPVVSITSPWPAGDVVYVVSRAGELICVARDSGQVYWIRDLNEGRERSEGGFLGAFDREVRPTWSGPVLASGRIVMVNTFGEAAAVNAKTGVIEKTVNLGAPAFIAPIAVNGTVYAVTDDATLVAIR
jgi:outer membrane protein assembly factor BamB